MINLEKIEGDKLLISIGQVLRNNIRKVDLPVRYDEARFMVLLPNSTKNETEKLAKKLCKLITGNSSQSRKKESTAKVTVSIGISSFPLDGTNGSTLIQCAEQAMFQAQNSGGNIVCVTNMQGE